MTRSNENGRAQSGGFEALRALLLDPEATVAQLPQEERDEYERCQRSVVDARRSANAIEGNYIIGGHA